MEEIWWLRPDYFVNVPYGTIVVLHWGRLACQLNCSHSGSNAQQPGADMKDLWSCLFCLCSTSKRRKRTRAKVDVDLTNPQCTLDSVRCDIQRPARDAVACYLVDKMQYQLVLWVDDRYKVGVIELLMFSKREVNQPREGACCLQGLHCRVIFFSSSPVLVATPGNILYQSEV